MPLSQHYKVNYIPEVAGLFQALESSEDSGELFDQVGNVLVHQAIASVTVFHEPGGAKNGFIASG